jgi:hypothetical protein
MTTYTTSASREKRNKIGIDKKVNRDKEKNINYVKE